MKIKIERSGGFAGIPSSNEIDSDKLPSSLEGTVRELLNPTKFPITKDLKRHRSAADYFNYKIIIKNRNKEHVIDCSELDMDPNIKSLISYVQKNSKKKQNLD